MPPRKSYTAAFKLEAVNYAKENGNRATARHFGIDEKMVRNWRKSEDQLRLTKKTKRANRGQKARWPALEETVESWVLEQRAANRGVSTIQIRLKAIAVAKELDIVDFNGGPSWCLRFMRRKALSIRARTTLCQSLPEDFKEKLATFRQYCSEKVTTYTMDPDRVINMDEVPLTFDMPMNRTVEKKGTASISIKTTGHEKASFTLVLAVTAGGTKLPPMIIFKRKTMPKEKFPKGIVVQVNEKGWMNNEMMKIWITECFSKRPDGFFHRDRALLVMDSMRAHITDDIKDILHAKNTTPAIIPGGMTKLLQPLDISVNRTFKTGMRLQWEQWMTSGEHSFTSTGRLRRATLSEVATWVLNAWKGVSKTCITNGFRKAEIYPYTDDAASDLSSDEDDVPLSNLLPSAIAELFHSDSEDEDFDGFSDC